MEVHFLIKCAATLENCFFYCLTHGCSTTFPFPPISYPTPSTPADQLSPFLMVHQPRPPTTKTLGLSKTQSTNRISVFL